MVQSEAINWISSSQAAKILGLNPASLYYYPEIMASSKKIGPRRLFDQKRIESLRLPEGYVSLAEAAAKMHLDHSTVWKRAESGKIPSILYHGKTYVPVEVVEAFSWDVPALTVSEAAYELDVSRDLVRRWIVRKRIPAIRVAKRLFVPKWVTAEAALAIWNMASDNPSRLIIQLGRRYGRLAVQRGKGAPLYDWVELGEKLVLFSHTPEPDVEVRRLMTAENLAATLGMVSNDPAAYLRFLHYSRGLPQYGREIKGSPFLYDPREAAKYIPTHMRKR